MNSTLLSKYRVSPEIFGRGLYISFIVKEMLSSDVPHDLVAEVARLSKTDDGIYALMDRWLWEVSLEEKEYLLDDMKAMISTYFETSHIPPAGKC